MAKIVGGFGCSHVPPVGIAHDKGITENSYWSPLFKALPSARKWIKDLKPDVLILVYNDHGSAFSLELIPTFAIGVAPWFENADEGYGPRKIPDMEGHPSLAWHITESCILDGFDLTIANKMDVDHGASVPMTVFFGEPEAWPVKVIPICVNVIQYPPPTAERCFNLGQAIRRAVDEYDEELRVVIAGTGGMSHQLQSERAGVINTEFDIKYLDNLAGDNLENRKRSHLEFIREAGSEGIELVMWQIMRGAMTDKVVEKFRKYHVASSNTAFGVICFEDAPEEKTAEEIKQMKEPALVEYANTLGINAHVNDLKKDTLEKVLTKLGYT